MALNSDQLRGMLATLINSKTAEATAEQMGMPPGGAPPGGDPAAMPPGGDPAAMDPAAMAAPPGPPPDLETLSAQGDPLAKELLEHRNLLTQILTALKLIMDQAQLKAPASQLLQVAPTAAPKKTAELPPPQPQLASAVEESPEVTEMPDGMPIDLNAAPTYATPASVMDSGPPPTWSAGRPGSPGTGGAFPIRTEMTPRPVGVGRQIADILRRA